MSTPTATIIVSVPKSKFYPLNKRHRRPRVTACTPATFTLQQPAPSGVSQVGGKIIISKQYLGANRLRIIFDLSSTGYTPTYTHLTQTAGAGDPQGHTNFPPGLRKAYGTTGYQIVDILKNHGKPSKWDWAIGIAVQDAAGNIGLLDPDIENQD